MHAAYLQDQGRDHDQGIRHGEVDGLGIGGADLRPFHAGFMAATATAATCANRALSARRENCVKSREGTSQVQRLVIARHVLKEAKPLKLAHREPRAPESLGGRFGPGSFGGGAENNFSSVLDTSACTLEMQGLP
jgi:hypothetical protein